MVYKAVAHISDGDASLPDALNDFYAWFTTKNNMPAEKTTQILLSKYSVVVEHWNLPTTTDYIVYSYRKDIIGHPDKDDFLSKSVSSQNFFLISFPLSPLPLALSLGININYNLRIRNFFISIRIYIFILLCKSALQNK